MNIQQLRQSLKLKWLSYYQQNRSWLVKLRIWGTYDGMRRPSSGFILATLSVLEQQLNQILPFLIDLSNNPDNIVAALGLNFNPDEELSLIKSQDATNVNQVNHEYLEDKYLQDTPLPAVDVGTKVHRESPGKTLHPKQPPVGFQPIKKPVSSVTLNHSCLRDARVGRSHRQPLPSIAVTTQEHRPSSATTVLLEKPPSEILSKDKPQRSPKERLPSEVLSALQAELLSQNKILPTLALTVKISNNGKSQISLSEASIVAKHSKPVTPQPKDSPPKITPVTSKDDPLGDTATEEENSTLEELTSVNLHREGNNLSFTTNARSLASWVDEFCYGAEID